MVERRVQAQDVAAATDIVALVGEHVALQRKGKEFAGLCPFHDDHSPSMQVSPQKQIFKCFSCGAGGSVFDFVMRYHKLPFVEAMKMLADRAGIDMAPPSPQEAKGRSERQQIAEGTEFALQFFSRSLADHAEAKAYLAKRQINEAMIRDYQIGYAPDGWDGLIRHARDKGKDLKSLIMAGLFSERRNGDGHVDRFRHRIMFPICDAMGRPIAFGGRKIRDEDEPKYLNSPEQALFNKSGTAYGLHLAKQAIIRDRVAVVVEGYTDVIACRQAGFENVVATLGTALTNEHVRLLKRFAEKVVLIFDADNAGQRAADRAIEVFLSGEMDVALATPPDGLDPADLMKTDDGKATWADLVATAPDALEYRLDRFQDAYATGGVTANQAAAEQFIDYLLELGMAKLNMSRRVALMHRLSETLGVSGAMVEQLIDERRDVRERTQQRQASRKAANAQRDSTGSTGSPDRSNPVYSPNRPENQEIPDDSTSVSLEPAMSAPKIRAHREAELKLIGCLMHDASLFHLELPDGRMLDDAVGPGDVTSSTYRFLYEAIYDLLQDEQPLDRHAVLSRAIEASAETMMSDMSSYDAGADVSQQDVACGEALADAMDRVEAETQLDAEKLHDTLEGAAWYIRRHWRDTEMRQLRSELERRSKRPMRSPGDVSRNLTEGQGDAESNAQQSRSDDHAAGATQDPPAANQTAPASDDEARLLRLIAEHHLTNPSPTRIARPRRESDADRRRGRANENGA